MSHGSAPHNFLQMPDMMRTFNSGRHTHSLIQCVSDSEEYPHGILQSTGFFSAPSSLWTDPLSLDDKYIFSQYFNHMKGSICFKMVADIFKHPDKLYDILKLLDLTSYPEFHNKMRVTYRLICGIFPLL